MFLHIQDFGQNRFQSQICLLYTSDAADERSSVDLGGRRIIKKKNKRIVHSIACVTHQNIKTCTKDESTTEISHKTKREYVGV